MRTRELKRFKKRLLKLKEQVSSEMGRFEDNILHKNRKETTGEVSYVYTTHPADMGGETAEFEMAYILASNEGDLLELIDEALERVESGEYGKCIECGDNIPLERLRAIPYTPYCVDCKEHMENGEYVK